MENEFRKFSSSSGSISNDSSYVIVTGTSKRISDRVMEIEDLLHSDRLTLDAPYYIGRTMMNPLSRIFNVVGANVKQWWAETPKYQPLRKVVHGNGRGAKAEIRVQTLELLMASNPGQCPLCEGEKEDGNREFYPSFIRTSNFDLHMS